MNRITDGDVVQFRSASNEIALALWIIVSWLSPYSWSVDMVIAASLSFLCDGVSERSHKHDQEKEQGL